jgi:hypothetical protein
MVLDSLDRFFDMAITDFDCRAIVYRFLVDIVSLHNKPP